MQKIFDRKVHQFLEHPGKISLAITVVTVAIARSLFENYLQAGANSLNLHSMISCQEATEGRFSTSNPKIAEPTPHSNYTPRHLVFKHRIPETEIAVNHSIEIFENCDYQDIRDWAQKFSAITRQCRWPEDIALTILRASLHLDIAQLISAAKTTQDAFKALFREKYPVSYCLKYYQEISLVKQLDYDLIKQYFVAIWWCVQKLAIAKDWDEKESWLKIEEAFLNGLGPLTALEMHRLGLSTLSAIVNRIVAVEESLLSSFRVDRRQPSYQQPQQNRTTQNKWCPLHRTKTHDKTECRTIARKDKERKHNGKPNNLIVEPSLETNPVQFPGTINNISVTMSSRYWSARKLYQGRTRKYVRFENARNRSGYRRTSKWNKRNSEKWDESYSCASRGSTKIIHFPGQTTAQRNLRRNPWNQFHAAAESLHWLLRK